MSRSPVLSLRSLWAHAGAPAAFVLADDLLAARLQRIAHDGAAPHALADTRAFAQLVAPFSFSAAFGPHDGEPPAIDAPLAMSPASPDRARRDAADSLRDRRTSRVPPAAAFVESAPPSADAPSIAGVRAVAGAPDVPTPRATAASGTLSVTEPGRLPAPSRTADAAARGTLRARTVAFGGPVAATWRTVPPVRTETEPAIAARIAAVLAVGAEPRPRATVDGSQPHDELRTAAASPSITAALLGGAVRRVEQRFAAAALRRHRERKASHDTDPYDRRVQRRDENGEVQAWSSSAPSARGEMDLRRSFGLRGLAERVARTVGERAPLFAPMSDGDDDKWPSGELDRFASLLDEAARHEGVDVDEGVV